MYKDYYLPVYDSFIQDIEDYLLEQSTYCFFRLSSASKMRSLYPDLRILKFRRVYYLFSSDVFSKVKEDLSLSAVLGKKYLFDYKE